MEITWLWSFFSLLSVPLFVAMNGLFVAAELALVAVRKTRVEEMVHHGQKGAEGVESAVVNLDRSIAAPNWGLPWLALPWAGPENRRLLTSSSRCLTSFLPPGRELRLTPWRQRSPFLITFLHVVFGELIPKTMALQMPDGIALWVAAP